MGDVFRLPQEKIGVFCAVIDLLSCIVTLSLLWSMSALGGRGIGYQVFSRLSLDLACAVGAFYLVGAYPGRSTLIHTASRIAAFFGITIVASSFASSAADGGVQTIPLLAAAAALALAMSWALKNRLLRPLDARDALGALLKKRVMLVGHGQEAQELARLARTDLGGSIEIVSVVELATTPIGNDSSTAAAAAAREISTALRRSGASSILLAGLQADAGLVDLAIELKCRGEDVCDLHALLQNHTGTIDPCASYEERIAFDYWPKYGTLARALKRAQDIWLALIVLVVTAPIFAAIAVGVKLTSRGPIFYRQTRTGLHGTPFEILKFRSMHVDAERDGNPQWAMVNDQRVTSFGRALRILHLDELPQLINILRGDMSFVGPRPERPVFVAELTSRIPCYRLRHMVKPGLTGWAQINYPYSATIEEARNKLAFDLYYLEHVGFFFDLFILARTIRVVALGLGSR